MFRTNSATLAIMDEHKKTGVAQSPKALHHAGLLFNEPLGVGLLRLGRAALYLVFRRTQFTCGRTAIREDADSASTTNSTVSRAACKVTLTGFRILFHIAPISRPQPIRPRARSDGQSGAGFCR